MKKWHIGILSVGVISIVLIIGVIAYSNSQLSNVSELSNTNKLLKQENRLPNLPVILHHPNQANTQNDNNVNTKTNFASEQVLVDSKWGSQDGQFGISIPEEASAEAPSVIHTDNKGQFYILDIVNKRIQLFDPSGAFVKSVILPSDTIYSFDVLSNGTLMALDRNKGLIYHLKDTDNKSFPLFSNDEWGSFTHISVIDKTIYLEKENTHLIPMAIISDSGFVSVTDNTKLAGRPVKFSSHAFMSTRIESSEKGIIKVMLVERDGKEIWQTSVQVELPILHILMLESSVDGYIYVAGEMGIENMEQGRFDGLQTFVARIDQYGKMAGTMSLPPTTEHPAETVSPLSITPSGEVLQLRNQDNGVTVGRFSSWQ